MGFLSCEAGAKKSAQMKRTQEKAKSLMARSSEGITGRVPTKDKRGILGSRRSINRDPLVGLDRPGSDWSGPRCPAGTRSNPRTSRPRPRVEVAVCRSASTDDFGKEGIVVERRFDSAVEAGDGWQRGACARCATARRVGLSEDTIAGHFGHPKQFRYESHLESCWRSRCRAR